MSDLLIVKHRERFSLIPQTAQGTKYIISNFMNVGATNSPLAIFNIELLEDIIKDIKENSLTYEEH